MYDDDTCFTSFFGIYDTCFTLVGFMLFFILSFEVLCCVVLFCFVLTIKR